MADFIPSRLALPSWQRSLLKLIERSWSIDAEGFVPSDQARFLTGEATQARRVWKFFRRILVLFFLGQTRRELTFIPPSARRILWINLSASSLGDSLMDLSSASLLSGRELHLLTSKKNACLHAAGQTFHKVFSEECPARLENASQAYDLVIVDAFTPRSLLPKVRISWKAPFVGMYGFLNGYEVHRTIYSYQRMRRLLGSSPHLSIQYKPHFRLSGHVNTPVIPRPYVCVVVGAEWEFRKYPFWAEVVKGLPSDLTVVLVGSNNGVRDAAAIMKECAGSINLVGKCSLLETVQIISESSHLLAADGGLWHVGSALSIPSVALFADCQLFDAFGRAVTRSTEDIPAITLVSKRQVSEISPSSIIEAFNTLQKRYGAARKLAENSKASSINIETTLSSRHS